MENYMEITPQEIEKNTFSLIGKEWMLVSAETEEKANTMTASWGGLGVIWNKNVAFCFLRPQRYTKEFIDKSERFSLCFFGGGYKEELSYLGRVSGRDENKIEKSGLTLSHFENVPYFTEAKMILVCKKLYLDEISKDGFFSSELEAKMYPAKDYHSMYIAEIEKVFVKK